MRRPGLVLAIVASLGAVVIGLAVFQDRWRSTETNSDSNTLSQRATMVGQTRPDFSLPDLEGISQSVSRWDGKVVALNFWATWCPPCKREIPLLNRLQATYGEQGIQFVGIAIDKREAVNNYLQETPVRYPVLVGPDQGIKVARAYGNDVGILPYTAFIDRQGEIASVHYGELSEKEAQAVIDSLLQPAKTP